MPRLPAVLLAALAGTAHAPWGGMDQNLLDCEYDLPQHACPTCEGGVRQLCGGRVAATQVDHASCDRREATGCCAVHAELGVFAVAANTSSMLSTC